MPASTETECVFCQLQRPNSHESQRIENTILAESNSFLVIPALGPLLPGHVLLISREHHESLAEMGGYKVRELVQLLDDLGPSMACFGPGMVVAEHGGPSGGPGGGCILHTHINLLAGVRIDEHTFAGLVPLREVASIHDIPTITRPYIFVMGDEFFAYDATGAPSQFIRQVLWRTQGRNDWDWAVHPYHDHVKTTIQQWRTIDRP